MVGFGEATSGTGLPELPHLLPLPSAVPAKQREQREEIEVSLNQDVLKVGRYANTIREPLDIYRVRVSASGLRVPTKTLRPGCVIFRPVDGSTRC